MVGAGGSEIRTFESVGRGRTRVRFNYVRPREQDVPPAEIAESRCWSNEAGTGLHGKAPLSTRFIVCKAEKTDPLLRLHVLIDLQLAASCKGRDVDDPHHGLLLGKIRQ